MEKEPNSDMNATSHSQPTACQKQIEPTMAELRNALRAGSRLTAQTPPEERDSVEQDICLASRSAYFDFYTWVVLNGEIDGPAEAELEESFKKALAVMQPGKFRDSVRDRHKEFNEQCARVQSGKPDLTPASSLDSRG